ncbi:MAG: hypothetical protein R3B96_06545 [Pirellulaceae bacterium]
MERINDQIDSRQRLQVALKPLGGGRPILQPWESVGRKLSRDGGSTERAREFREGVIQGEITPCPHGLEQTSLFVKVDVIAQVTAIQSGFDSNRASANDHDSRWCIDCHGEFRG